MESITFRGVPIRPMTHCEHVMAMTRSILNKLTPTNESVLKEDFLGIEFRDEVEMQGVVDALFERAAVEQRYISTYARFCTNKSPMARQACLSQACLKLSCEEVFAMEGTHWLAESSQEGQAHRETVRHEARLQCLSANVTGRLRFAAQIDIAWRNRCGWDGDSLVSYHSLCSCLERWLRIWGAELSCDKNVSLSAACMDKIECLCKVFEACRTVRGDSDSGRTPLRCSRESLEKQVLVQYVLSCCFLSFLPFMFAHQLLITS